MTTNYLWFVLAGFLLGFVTSTLWEWYHFRKERLKLTDRRIRELEEKVQELEASALQNDDAPEWSARAYRSPGVFLESEEFAPEPPPEAAPAPDPVPSVAPIPAAAPVALVLADNEAAEGRADRGDATPLTNRTAAVRSRQELLETLRRNSEVMQRGHSPRAEPVAALESPQPPVAPVQPLESGDVNVQSNDESGRGASGSDDLSELVSSVARGSLARLTRADNGATVPAEAPAEAENPVRQRWRDNAELTRRTQEMPDDLLKIKGIGEVYKVRLYRAGIYTWRQIAEANQDELRRATSAYPSSNVDEWPVQARELMEKYGRKDAVYHGPPPDDLTKIFGIGRVSAAILYRTGICTYEQLAVTTEADLAELFPIAVAGDQPDFAAWIARAPQHWPTPNTASSVAMIADPPRQPPYVDWSLDRWKIGTILALFVGLLAALLATPASPDVAAIVPASGLVNPLVSPSSSSNAPVPNTAPVIVPGSLVPEASLPIPLTLAMHGPNAVLPAESVRVLSGTASPQSLVEVRTQVMGNAVAAGSTSSGGGDTVLGTTRADDLGLWQVALDPPLQSGQHVLSLRELDERGQVQTVSDPIMLTVLAPGELGPLALAIPEIRTPATGTRLAPGPVAFTGSGLPGLMVQLYLNGEQVASGMVSTDDSWTLTPDSALDTGVYLARVLAITPQGEVLAESAPVTIVVEQVAARSSPPATLPNPSLPLTVSGLAFGDRRRTSLIVSGLATPHVAVAAWLDGQPMQQTNATVEGSWSVVLDNPIGFDARDVVQIRSSLGEQVRTDLTRQAPIVQSVDVAPRLISPQAGEVLTSPQPLLTGAAQPGAVVAILINEQVVAEVTADAQGRWAFQLKESLPNGIVALAVGPGRRARPARLAAPVVVTIAPQL